MDPTEAGLAWRLEQVEAQLAIRQLVARYCFAIDDRDLATVADLFDEHARFASLDGVMEARGRAAIVSQFEGRYSVLGATNHVSHDYLITLDPNDPDKATGKLSSHAELWRNGQAMLVCLRYHDAYVRGADFQWRFAERLLGFFYYRPVSDYAAALGVLDRMRAYEAPAPADYPERLATWKDWR
jgi:ketosteroid isomerase-like protein